MCNACNCNVRPCNINSYQRFKYVLIVLLYIALLLVIFFVMAQLHTVLLIFYCVNLSHFVAHSIVLYLCTNYCSYFCTNVLCANVHLYIAHVCFKFANNCFCLLHIKWNNCNVQNYCHCGSGSLSCYGSSPPARRRAACRLAAGPGGSIATV